MKTVVYQPGMEELARELTFTGYRTVCITDADKTVQADAVLVDRDSLRRALSTELCANSSYGALLVDVTDTDIATIKKILVKRSYHSLLD